MVSIEQRRFVENLLWFLQLFLSLTPAPVLNCGVRSLGTVLEYGAGKGRKESMDLEDKMLGKRTDTQDNTMSPGGKSIERENSWLPVAGGGKRQ